MPKPERRTRGDLVAAAVITIGVLVTGAVLWRYGDARATTSETAAATPPALPVVTALPPSLGQAWQARSRATPAPVVAGASVVTADGNEVTGRDPISGEVRWRYARDIPVCTAAPGVFDAEANAHTRALAAFSKDPAYCSEVVMLDGGTGRRVDQRNGDAERGTRIVSDGVHITAAGTRYLETWRSDLVRTTQFGHIEAVLNPNKQPRPDCDHGSTAVGSNFIALIERCPREDSDRLTVLKANPAHSETPEVKFSVLLGMRGAHVVGVAVDRVAVLAPDPSRLVVYDSAGNQTGVHELDVTVPTTSGKVEVPDTVATPTALYWFTGSSTIALNPVDFTPQWTTPDTIGTTALLAGRLVVPVADGLAVLDGTTGERIGEVPVDRGGFRGTVRLATAGPVVLEQRGDLLVALR